MKQEDRLLVKQECVLHLDKRPNNQVKQFAELDEVLVLTYCRL